MNRKEFLRKLQMELYKLPRHEIDDAIAYYNEYFEEAGPEQEQDVIRELGTPSKIATQIKADYAVRQLESMESRESKKPNGGYRDDRPEKAPGKLSAAWWVVIGIAGGIFAAPVAIPVAFVLAALLVTVFIGIIVLLISVFITAVVLIITSIIAVIFGLTLLATSAPLAILIIGLGLMGISLMALLTVGIVALTNLFFKAIARKRRESQEKRMEKRQEKLRQKYGVQQSSAGSSVPPSADSGTQTSADSSTQPPAVEDTQPSKEQTTEKVGDDNE